jgi:hypothetical protein
VLLFAKTNAAAFAALPSTLPDNHSRYERPLLVLASSPIVLPLCLPKRSSNVRARSIDQGAAS